jgi:hypothetical protein
MPKVTELMRGLRAKHGARHVNECWSRGVLQREPGWFYAREGALAVGTPWSDPELGSYATLELTSTQALLIIKPSEAAHGQDC